MADLDISVVETVTVTENVGGNLFNIDPFDTVSVAEYVAVELALGISVYDEVGVAESVSAVVSDLNASVYDEVGVAESIGNTPDALIPVVNDSVSVTEYVNSIITTPIELTAVPVYDSGLNTYNGIDEFTNTGSSFQSYIRDSFTWILDVQPDDGQPASNEALIGLTGSSDYFNILLGIGGSIIINFDVGAMGGHPDIQINIGQASTGFTNGVQSESTRIVFVITKDTSLSVYIGSAVAVSDIDLSGWAGYQEQYTSSDNFHIGNYYGGSAFFDGSLRARLYDSALTESEIIGAVGDPDLQNHLSVDVNESVSVRDTASITSLFQGHMRMTMASKKPELTITSKRPEVDFS